MICLQILIICLIYVPKSLSIVITCDYKNADVGYSHFFTCEVSKPPLDTSHSKFIESAFGFPLNTDRNEVKQFYTEYVNAINFPVDLNTIFNSLEIIRMWKSNVKFLEPMDLRNLKNLRILDLEENELEVIQTTLFIYNPHLTEIYLQKNKIKFIASRVFNAPYLLVLNLKENICVDQNAKNNLEITRLRQQIEENCSAPEFLLKKNSILISAQIDCNFSLNNTLSKNDILKVENKNLSNSLSMCDAKNENLKQEIVSRNKQIQKNSNEMRRIENDLKSKTESIDELILENVKLTNVIRNSNQRLLEIEKVVGMSNASCLQSDSISSLEVSKMRYENDKLRRENLILKAFKEDAEREYRSVKLKCLFVNWNGIYSCQSNKFKVKIDDAEIEKVDGVHYLRKTNYDVKKLFIHSNLDVNTIFLPINIGATFQKIESIFAINCNLASIKSENFDNMMSLKELNLNYNSIQEIPYDAFIYPENLEKLSIAFNQINVLHKNTFDHLINLRYLVLNNNKMQKLSSDTFKSNRKLEIIFLQNNEINFIASRQFTNLHQLAIINLKNNTCIDDEIKNFNNVNEKITSICS
ncbi:hypothetical protein PVAND_006832 [Polypedilum vanderplanki]|uniref:Uncharacterized protein n=1 Tax=Polypedilum vanderplanki TaxID=319348 RepID=A0A9J6C5C4_POLVA|nr:hypothetical protein PVAND_006832 [Polypedilum vanderplanki]